MASGTEWRPTLKQCVIAVGGGKGGTGKSLLAANLGIALAELRQQVIVVDLDLGGANLHSCLGIRSPQNTLADFLQNKVKRIEHVLLPTWTDQLKLINGSNDPLEIVDLPYAHKLRLIRQIKSLQADYILLDLGGGTSPNVLDFFLSSDYGIVVGTPEPTSLENVSLFIKCFMMRHLKMLLRKCPVKHLRDRIKDPRNRDTARTVQDLLRLIRSFDEQAADHIEAALKKLRLGFVLNKIREQSETQIGTDFQSMIRRCLGIRVDHLGQIWYEEKIPRSVKRLRPFLVEYPHAKGSHSIRMVAKRLLGMDRLYHPSEQGSPLFTRGDRDNELSETFGKTPDKNPETRPHLRFYM